MEQQHSTRALSRHLHVIEILTESRDGLRLTEIAQKARLSKSSTHRLIETLIQEGFVAQNGESAYYRLWLKLLWLASELDDGSGLDQLIRPRLRDCAQKVTKVLGHHFA